MKSFFVLCVLAGVALALADNTYVDFSTVKPIHELPEFLETHKAIADLIKENGSAKKSDSRILGGEIAEQGQFSYSVS